AVFYTLSLHDALPILFDLIENPRITNGRSSDHYTIDSIFLFIFHCFLRRIYIAISKNWNFYVRISFYLCYFSPISFSFVHLRTRSEEHTSELQSRENL